MAIAEKFDSSGEKLTKKVAGDKYISAEISDDVDAIVESLY
jgi:hypothetical protein